MKKISKICFVATFLALNCHAQNEDKNWPVGHVEFPGVPGFANSLVSFENGQVSVEEAQLNMNFESTVAAISDSLGQLLFYSNGCSIFSADGSLMANGDGLNPGEIRDWVCPQKGYICQRGAMALPSPEGNGKHYLFHQGTEYDPEVKIRHTRLYFSLIDMMLQGGKGEVVIKNQLLREGDFESFAAARHANGRDWWLVMPEFSGNRYFSFLLNPGGVSLESVSETGPMFNCRSRGTVVFSKDGSKMARFDGTCRAAVFDFDRCSGELTNPLEIRAPTHAFGGGGAAFSPNGRFLFGSNQNVLLRADLSAAIPKLDTLKLLDQHTFGSTLHLMQLAPNDKIYITPVSRAQFWHVVPTPDASSPVVEILPKAVSLKGFSVRSLPNFPNFRLAEIPGSPCGLSGLTTFASRTKINVTPNPVNREVVVSISQSVESQWVENWELFDFRGRAVFSAFLENEVNKFSLPPDLPEGFYLWRVLNTGENGKLVIVETND